MKLDSKVFRDAANIYLWDGKSPRGELNLGCCPAIIDAADHYCIGVYISFFKKHFKPKNKATMGYWWNKGWRFWTQAAVQRHRKKMLLKAADLVDKMNAEEK